MRRNPPALTPLPSAEQLVLLRRAKLGDKAARDQLVLTNQRLVFNIVSRYLRKFHIGNLERDDFNQVGMEALLESIDKFNLNYSNAFTTYATYRIRHRLNHLIEQYALPVRLNIRAYEKVGKPTMRLLQNPMAIVDAETQHLTPTALIEVPNYPDYHNIELLRHALAVRGLLTQQQQKLLLSWAGAGEGKQVGQGGAIRFAMARLKWYMSNMPLINED